MSVQTQRKTKQLCVHYMETHRVVAECVVQGIAWKDGGVAVDLVQSYHQAGDSAGAHVSSTERLHESEVEWRGPARCVLQVWVHLEHLSIVQHWLRQTPTKHQHHQQRRVHHEIADQARLPQPTQKSILVTATLPRPSYMQLYHAISKIMTSQFPVCLVRSYRTTPKIMHMHEYVFMH